MKKHFIKDFLKYAPTKITPALIGLISIPIITRLFHPEDYGNYVLVISTASFLTLFVGWLNMAIIRFYAIYKRNDNLGIFYSTVLISFLVSIFSVSLLFLIGIIITEKSISHSLFSLMLIGVLIFIFSSVFQILLDFLRAKRLVNWYSGFIVWKNIAAIGIGLILVFIFKFAINGLLWGIVISIVLILPLLWKESTKGIIFTRHFSFNLAKDMANFGVPLVMANLAAWVLSLSDRYMIGLFRNVHEVGVYSVSYAVSEKTILFMVSLFLLAASPIEINIWENKGKKESQLFIGELTRYFLILCLPAVFGLSVLAKPIISVFAGQGYLEGYHIIPFVTLSIFFLGLYHRFGGGVKLYKKTNLSMYSFIIGALVNIGLNYVFIPKYGYFAAAVTTLLGYIIMLVLIIYLSRKFFTWPFPFGTLLRTICAAALMSVIVYYRMNKITASVISNLILNICLGSAVYFILLFLLGEFRPAEKEKVKQILKHYLLKKNTFKK